MDFKESVLWVILPMSLIFILCIILSVIFSRRLKPLRYAPIVPFIMIVGLIRILCIIPTPDEWCGVLDICVPLISVPGFFLALPLICFLPHGPCSEEPFYAALVFSFIFYTLLIFGIIKLWHLVRKRSLQKNGDKQGQPPISEAG